MRRKYGRARQITVGVVALSVAGHRPVQCGAVRTARIHDESVTGIETINSGTRRGLATCTRCGARDVDVVQLLRNGGPRSSWHYSPHSLPVSG